jgi:hypothetical protein
VAKRCIASLGVNQKVNWLAHCPCSCRSFRYTALDNCLLGEQLGCTTMSLIDKMQAVRKAQSIDGHVQFELHRDLMKNLRHISHHRQHTI